MGFRCLSPAAGNGRPPAGGRRSPPMFAVAVVGAGPHALTLSAAHLLDRYHLAGDVVVFDPRAPG